MRRVLITGASGLVGGVLREQLRGRHPLVLLDRVPPAAPTGDESVVVCDIRNGDRLREAMVGVDSVVHLAGEPTETSWERIMEANIDGCYRVVEAARQSGVRRLVFASSNHAVGFHARSELIDAGCMPRPDTRYGVSKVFGEALLRFYADKFGLTSVCLRIGTVLRPDAPRERRHLSTWLSHRDLGQLLHRSIEADVDYAIVYGVSNNTRRWWRDDSAECLGYHPVDDAEAFAATLGLQGDGGDPVAERHQGGVYCSWEREI